MKPCREAIKDVRACGEKGREQGTVGNRAVSEEAALNFISALISAAI